jgi:hypothetical protein
MRSIAIVLALATPALAQLSQVLTFEELAFPGTQQHVNSAAFTSGGASFNNAYSPPFPPFGEFWSGFAYSKVKDVVTPGVDAGGNVINGHAAFYKPTNTPDPVGFNAGAGGSTNYAVGYDGSPFGLSPVITLPTGNGAVPASIALANTTYTAISMRDGDAFGKKFGGTTGNDPDFLKVIVTGRDANGDFTGRVEHYLADFRFADNSQDYIQSAWQTVDLTPIAPGTRTLTFTFDSSDFVADLNGNVLYYNTPFYVAVDDVTFTTVPEPAGLSALLLLTAIRYRKR